MPQAIHTIRPATLADAGAVARIYNHYVLHTIVTFDETAVADEEMAARMHEAQAAGFPFLCAEQDGQVVGFAYASKWKGRCGYRHSAEITVYLDPERIGQGVGTALYSALLPALKERSVHAVIGGIALPNEASVALHEKFGLSQVAHFREVGQKFGKWIDVGYWERIL